MQFNALTLTLNNFIAAFSGGYGRLAPEIHRLLWLLGGIEIVLLGLWWALDGGERLVPVFKKILFIGFWIWVVDSFPRLAQAFVGSLIDAGLIAGGQPGNYALLMDPSRIAGHGLDATMQLARKLEALGTFDVGDQIVFGLGYLAIMACFLIMAINVFMAVLEYYLFVAVVGILVPFGLLKSTKFLAEKAIGAVVSAGIKLMVLAFIVAVIEPVLAAIRFAGPEIAMNELWAVLLTAGACTLLSWNAPRLAAGLLSGSPALSAVEAAGGAVAALGAAFGVAGLFGGSGAGAAAAASAAGAARGGSSGDRGASGAAAASTRAADVAIAARDPSPTAAAPSASRAGEALVRSLQEAPTVVASEAPTIGGPRTAVTPQTSGGR